MGSLCNADGSKIMSEDDGYETAVPGLNTPEVTQDEVDSAMWAYQEATGCACYEDGIRAALSSFLRDRIEAEQLNQDKRDFMALTPEIRAHLLSQVRILRHD